MSRVIIYDFIDAKAYRTPAGRCPVADAEQDGYHGVRPLLRPSEDAKALLRDHARLLAKSRDNTAS